MKLNSSSLIRSVIVTIVMLALLLIAGVWFELFDDERFWKVAVTLVIVGATLALVFAARSDLAEEDTLKKDKFFN